MSVYRTDDPLVYIMNDTFKAARTPANLIIIINVLAKRYIERIVYSKRT